MIKFESLTIEGFASIQDPLVLNFNSRGLTLIKGPNGYGKTTIPSALVWCLYGVTLKKNSSILTWEHKRKKGYKGAMVTVKFTKNNIPYTIIRCKEYLGKIESVVGKNRVFVFKGEKPIDDRGVKDINKTIIDLLGMGSDLFLASVVFGQKMKRLIEEDGPKKKAILEEAFNITYINKALEKAKEDRDAIKAIVTKLDNQISNAHTLMTRMAEELSNLYSIRDNFEKDKKEKIERYEDQLAKAKKSHGSLKLISDTHIGVLEEDLAKLAKQRDAYRVELIPLKEVDKKESNARIKRDNIKRDLDKKEKYLESLMVSRLCPTCGQAMTTVKVTELKSEAQTDINTLKASLTEVNKMLLGYKKELASLTSVQTKYSNADDNYYKKLEEKRFAEMDLINYKNSQKNLTQLEKYLKEAKDQEMPDLNIESVESNLKKAEEDIETLAKEYRRVNKKLGLYNWLITTPLSNSGLKVYIFNQMLQKVNVILKNYTPYIGFTPRFEVDLENARKDINMVIYSGKYPINYPDLSGGQSQLVNIAVAFAIHELVSSDHINILFLDEVFESLSENNIEIVSSIIEAKSRDKAIYLITHLSDFVSQNSEILEISLDNNTTRLG